MFRFSLRLSAFAVLAVVFFVPSTFAAHWESINIQPAPASASAKSRSASPGNFVSQLRLPSDENIQLVSQYSDRRGRQHTRYQQTYRNLPVWGQQVILHQRGGTLERAHGRLLRGLPSELAKALPTDPASQASSPSADTVYLDIARQWLADNTGTPASQWTLRAPRSIRQIYQHTDGKAHVVRVVDFFATRPGKIPAHPWVLIAESDQQILLAFDGLNHAQGSGPGGNIKTGEYHYGVDRPHLDVTEVNGVCSLQSARIITADLQNEFFGDPGNAFEFPCFENTNRPVNGAYAPMNDAHYLGDAAVAMYQNWIGVDPVPLPVRMGVHVGLDYDNAFWDGNAAYFGDGGHLFHPLTSTDVVAHEISHGFTQQHSNLIYHGQSGAINESFSDIAGEALEFYLNGENDWLVGGELHKTAPALRFFKNPADDGHSVAHAKDYQDHLNVHLGSGIFNRAFYLLATTPGWDVRRAFEAYAHANMAYWTPLTTLDEAACGVFHAADDLGYSPRDVSLAFAQVGVYCIDDTFDSDGDGLPDMWEIRWGLNPQDPEDAHTDRDQDGLDDLGEYTHRSNPSVADSDDDTLSDGYEVATSNTSPILKDTDADGMRDDYELQHQLNPLDAADALLDNDGDGLSNLLEYQWHTDPNDPLSVADPQNLFFDSFENGVDEVWEFSGTASTQWQVNSSWASHGNQSLAAFGLQPGEFASAKLDQAFEAGTFSFRYSIASTSNPFLLEVYHNGELVMFRTGGTNNSFLIQLAPGYHEFEFRLTNNGTTLPYSQVARIDEVLFQTSNLDLDGDGMPNVFELKNGFDPRSPADASLDLDQDGLTNLEEHQQSTLPNQPDTDGDGLTDGAEVHTHGTTPIRTDTDLDGMSDGFEVQYQLNPLDASDAPLDADGDGTTNLEEFQRRTDPNDPASIRHLQHYFFESFEGTHADDWIFSGTSTAHWQLATDWAKFGTGSLAIRNLADSQTASAVLERVFARGTLYVEVRTSTESVADPFRIFVDGVYRGGMSGGGSNRLQISVSAGYHKIEFVYLRDESGSSGSNTVWIDGVAFISENRDIDGDGMDSRWELDNLLDPQNPADASLDNDNDGLTNVEEYAYRTSILQADTDNDGLSDGEEVHQHGTSPTLPDTDNDNIPDAYELAHGFNPLDAEDAGLDVDGDGATNLEEYQWKTDPHDPASVRYPYTHFLESFETTLSSEWTFASSIGRNWRPASYWKTHGSSSLTVPNLESGATSTATLTRVFEAGTISFDYCTTFSFTTLRFYVDGFRRLTASGDRCSTFSTQLSAGYHELRFELSRTGSTYRLSGDANVDNLVFINNNPDVDGDELPTVWEMRQGLNPDNAADAELDPDNDGLSNREEYLAGTDTQLPDTDNDGLNDGDEVHQYGSSPHLPDTDSDGMPDFFEATHGLEPANADDSEYDKDNDGATNLEEYQINTNPVDPASVQPRYPYFIESFEEPLSAHWENSSTAYPWTQSVGWRTHGDASLAITRHAAGVTSTLTLRRLYEQGTFSFDYCANQFTENRYYFYVYVDDVLSLDVNTSGCNTHAIPLSRGYHKIAFRFYRSTYSNLSGGSLYIDNVLFVHGNPDLDEDGMPTPWELRHGLDPGNPGDALQDADSDGLNNVTEYAAEADPTRPDTDNDGLGDGEEVHQFGTSPTAVDSDGDLIPDHYEVQQQFDPLDPADALQDVDGDGVSNLNEFKAGTDPQDATSYYGHYQFFLESFEDGLPADWSRGNNQGTDWESTADWSSHGNISLFAENFAAAETRSLFFTRYFSAGYLRLDYRLARIANCCTSLLVYVDGVLVRSASSIGGGTLLASIAEGAHAVEIRVHNSGGSANEDAVWIDAVSFTGSVSDGDSMDDLWELKNGLNPESALDAADDPDEDGLSNGTEYRFLTSPHSADTDNDGVSDGDEINLHGTSPVDADSDLDLMPDLFEIQNQLDPRYRGDAAMDNDADGISNAGEYLTGTNPNDANSRMLPANAIKESFEAPLSSNWTFNQTEGKQRWMLSDEWSSDGRHSLRTDGRYFSGYAIATFSSVFPAGTLSFSYLLPYLTTYSSFSVSVDGVNVFAATGSSAQPRLFSTKLSAGFHRIEIRYYKNRTHGTRYVAIDDFRFVADGLGTDWDNDGMANQWEMDFDLNPFDPADATTDLDADGFNALQEFQAGSDPTAPNIELKTTINKIVETNSSLIRYRVTVSNEGTLDASNVQLSNLIPSELLPTLSWTSSNIASDACDILDTGMDCHLGAIPGASAISLTLSVTTPNQSTKYPFTARVTAVESDLNNSNDSVSGQYAGSFQWFLLVMLATWVMASRLPPVKE